MAPLLSLALALLAALLLALGSGSSATDWADVPRLLWAPDDSPAAEIIHQLRLPRALAAVATGALLALAGALMQVLLRNPLADPYVLGLSGGAALGALGAMALGAALWGVHAGAFGGALVAVALVFALARQEWSRLDSASAADPTPRLLLTGVMLSSLASAGVSLILTLAPGDSLRGMLFWMLGDLSGAVALWPVQLAPWLMLALLLPFGRDLNVLLRGAGPAQMLGVPVARLRLGVFVLASAAAALAVATAGSVGFVGLVVPHALRLLLGHDQRLLLPASALAGGAFLLLADTAARTLAAPLQLPVGAITALVGAPSFIFLLLRAPRGGRLAARGEADGPAEATDAPVGMRVRPSPGAGDVDGGEAENLAPSAPGAMADSNAQGISERGAAGLAGEQTLAQRPATGTRETPTASTATPLLHTRALHLRVNPQPGTRVLVQALDLSIQPGQFWCLLGRNGAGKTQLLHALAGMRPAQGGAVFLQGRPLDDWPLPALARQRGLVPQSLHDAFATPVLDVVLQGRHPHVSRWHRESPADVAAARQQLARLGLAGMGGRDVGSLSGGERQRVALATLLMQNPPLALLDEPLAHLDWAQQWRMAALLKRELAGHGRAVLMSVHDLSLARQTATHVLLLMGDGRTVAGPVAEVMTPEALAAAFGHPLHEHAADGRLWWLPGTATG